MARATNVAVEFDREPIVTVGDPAAPTVAGETEAELNGGTKEEPEEVLAVKYFGRSDQRILTRHDLSGERNTPNWGIVWTPDSKVSFDFFMELAGTRERASEVLRAHAHEFKLVGPGAEEFWEDLEGSEEFSVGGQVT